uniref:Transmembrane protein n=1 Tax=Gossypium raimondii TaxID=29730 RepID=A0A0D2UMT5_GOSRA|nr:hypothetical protein B456_009G156500 [Gossypium raimondii]
MGGTKRWVLFKRFMTKEAWRWKCFGSAFKWKRLNIKRSFVDNVVFKLVSVLEAIYLVATLCFFYLCCGWKCDGLRFNGGFHGEEIGKSFEFQDFVELKGG